MKDRFNQPGSEPPEKDKALDELKKFSNEQMEKYGPTHWILDESGEVIPASLLEWAFWFEKNPQRIIQQDLIEDHKVSTIFEGLSMYRLAKNERPVVFETMVFGPERIHKWFNGTEKMMRPSLWQERNCTLKEALATHERAIEWLKDYLCQKKTKE